MSRVILCYSRQDQATAIRITEELTDRGFAVHIDAASLPSGEWLGRLEEMIHAADSVVYLISRASLASELCNYELSTALKLNKKIVPVLLQKVDGAAIPEFISRLNFVYFDDMEGFANSVDLIAAALQTDIGWHRQHTKLDEQAQHWLRRDKDNDYLLRGTALDEAKRWIAQRPAGSFGPTELCMEYIAESERQQAGSARPEKRSRPPKPRGPKVFISYRRSDSSQTAGRVYDRLRLEIPEEDIVFDVNSIPIGVDFKEHIRTSLEQCAVVLAVIGKSWISRQWSRRGWWRWRSSAVEDFVETELRLAFEFAVPIIPILIEEVEMPKRSSLPASIAELMTLNAAPVRSGRDFHSDMEQVLIRMRPLRAAGAAQIHTTMVLTKDAPAARP